MVGDDDGERESEIDNGGGEGGESERGEIEIKDRS